MGSRQKGRSAGKGRQAGIHGQAGTHEKLARAHRQVG